MDNGVGVVGVAQNLILSCRALNDDGSGTSTAVAQCIRWCADTGAKVINMSLGSPAPSSEIESAVNYAVDTARVVAIAAAGNDGASSLNYPAAYPAVISVGAIDTSGRKAYFSNYGSNLDVVAPGVYILSTVPYINRYMFLMGTSMATPHVSGLAGLILSKNPNLSPSEVRAIITGTAIDMGEMGKDWFYGYGLINVYRALLATPSPVLTSDTREGNIRVKVSGRKVVIEGIEEFKIYSSDGRFVFSGKEFEGFLNVGIYFVKGEREVLKFVVR
jgi:subtilisin family serine protease